MVEAWKYVLAFGGIFVIFLFSVISEHRKPSNEILLINPLLVLLRLVGCVGAFYGLYALCVFAFDVAAGQLFFHSQMFLDTEFTFDTERGDLNIAALVVTFALLSFPFVLIVRRSRDMLDFSFSVALVHLVIVCAVGGGLPDTGAWWFSAILGFIILSFLAEYVAYKLEIMPYKSMLGTTVRDKKPKTPLRRSLSSLRKLSSGDLKKKSKEDVTISPSLAPLGSGSVDAVEDVI